MANWFHCFQCRSVHPLLGEKQEERERKCSTCGSTNVEVISQQRFQEGFEAGVFFNIDPKTGKRTKKGR
jgi:hypothetical protein